MKQVFFDIDTQIDFLYPAGALYVPGAERILPAIEHLNRYAAARGIPVVSSMDAHAEDEEEFRRWPPHCVAGTAGQRKPASTILARAVVIPSQPAAVRIEGAQQILLEKQKLDLFSNPNIGKLLELLQADRYVVYGVVTEYCVKCAVMGLLATGKPVTLVTDAIETLDRAEAERVVGEFRQRRGELAQLKNFALA